MGERGANITQNPFWYATLKRQMIEFSGDPDDLVTAPVQSPQTEDVVSKVSTTAPHRFWPGHF